MAIRIENGLTKSAADLTYEPINIDLHLDQTIIQHVINNPPQFDEGITIKANKRIYLDGT
jgi:hypothetical protein